jgi:hypothetical protein
MSSISSNTTADSKEIAKKSAEADMIIKMKQYRHLATSKASYKNLKGSNKNALPNTKSKKPKKAKRPRDSKSKLQMSKVSRSYSLEKNTSLRVKRCKTSTT